MGPSHDEKEDIPAPSGCQFLEIEPTEGFGEQMIGRISPERDQLRSGHSPLAPAAGGPACSKE